MVDIHRSETQRVARAAGVVAAATLLSRVFGFVRDAVLAWFLGAGMGADAFIVAFRIPNLLRRLFAEGSLSVAFVPVFSESLAVQGKEEATRMACSALQWLSMLLAAAAAAGILIAPFLVRIIAPGFGAVPAKLALTIALTRLMFPYVFFIGLVALCMGILNALDLFAAPALAPVLLNLSMIGAVFCVAPRLKTPIYGLAGGVIVGGMLQLALQIPFLVKKGVRFWKIPFGFHPRLRRVLVLMLPMVFGAAVYQINILVGTLLASLLPQGSVSYLYYADRLVQFPLGIFATAAGTAVLPSLSRQAAAKDLDRLRQTFGWAMQLITFITLPAMVGLILLRQPIVALLFQRGAFDAETTQLTAQALLYYGIGLWAFSAVRIVVSTFYALQDTRTPVITATFAIVVNVALSLALMGPMRHAGLALATSVASMFNLGLLLFALKAKLGCLPWPVMIQSAARSAFGVLVMGVGVWFFTHRVFHIGHGSGWSLLWVLIGSIAIGMALYILVATAIGSPELAMAGRALRRGKTT